MFSSSKFVMLYARELYSRKVHHFCLPAEEHQARLKAEADAENAARRLTVAQEQIAEYALQREREAGILLSQVQTLQSLLTSALKQGNGEASSLDDLTAQLQVRVQANISKYLKLEAARVLLFSC
jgi:hypothetical protein